MFKKIIAAVAAIAFSICFFSVFRVYAASNFITKKDGQGKSYISGYSGKGGSVTIPSSVSYIGENAFKDNTKITAVTIPSSCESIEKNAFANCVNLKSITFKGDVSHIGESAFINCISLEKISFEKSDAAIDYIGKKAFVNCFELDSVILPSNMEAVNAFAFGNCISLESVTVPKSVKTIEKNAFGFLYDEKAEDYFLADGVTQAYISYCELYDGELMEWYAPNVGKALSMNVVKGSAGEKYASGNGIEYALYKEVSAPKVTASADVDSVTLKWNKIDGADVYMVKILKNGRFENYKKTSAKSCVVTGLESNTKYTFKVAVLKKIKTNKYSELISSEEITVTTKKAEVIKEKSTIPDAPKVTAEAYSNSVALSWKKVDNADKYRIEIYDSEAKKFIKYNTVNGCSCTVTGLKSGTEYTFRVVSLYKVKNKYLDGGVSGEIVISTANVVVSK